MKSIRLLDRRVGYTLSSIGLLLGVVAPAALPAFASADQMSARSVTMSSSVANDTSVSYNIKFTAANDIDATASAEGGLIIGFCSNSPLTETACTMPAGFSTSGVGVAVGSVKYAGSPAASDGTASSIDFTGVPNANSGVKWVAGDDYTGGTTFEITLTGIHNPSALGTFYVRVASYNAKTDLDSFTADDDLGTYQDDGAVALSTTSSIGVTAYVMESMTFCVSKGDVGNTGDLFANNPGDVAVAQPSENCGAAEAGCPSTAGCVVTPSMALGQITGPVTALDTTHVSTGSVYAQLSTNASGGAVVNLKSDAVGCGGLYRNGVSDAAHCGIGPQTSSGSSALVAGASLFGVTVGSSSAAPLTAGGAGTGSGTLQIANSSGYDATHPYINAVTNNSTGVTSTYGTPLLDTNGTQTSNLNIPVTFNAAISPTTAAGQYGANFNMIATGTF